MAYLGKVNVGSGSGLFIGNVNINNLDASNNAILYSSDGKRVQGLNKIIYDSSNNILNYSDTSINTNGDISGNTLHINGTNAIIDNFGDINSKTLSIGQSTLLENGGDTNYNDTLVLLSIGLDSVGTTTNVPTNYSYIPKTFTKANQDITFSNQTIFNLTYPVLDFSTNRNKFQYATSILTDRLNFGSYGGTVEFMFKKNTNNVITQYLYIYLSTQPYLYIYIQSNKLYLSKDLTVLKQISIDNNWYYVALSFDHNNNKIWYYVSSLSSNITTITGNNYDYTQGTITQFTHSISDEIQFNGYMCNIRFTQKPLYTTTIINMPLDNFSNSATRLGLKVNDNLHVNGSFESNVDISGNTIHANNITLSAGTSAKAPIQLNAGTKLSSTTVGAIEYDASGLYMTTNSTSGRGEIPVYYQCLLSADEQLIHIQTPFFGINKKIILESNNTYEVYAACFFSKYSDGVVRWIWSFSSPIKLLTSFYQGTYQSGFNNIGTRTNNDPDVDSVGAMNTTSIQHTDTHTLNGTDVYTMHFLYRFTATVITISSTTMSLDAASNISGGANNSITPLAGSYYTVRKIAGSVGNFSS